MKISKSYSRLGTESAFVILSKAQKLISEGKEIINLGIGQPDFTTPDHIISACKKALDEGYHGYTDPNGIFELREGVSRYIKKKYKSYVDASRIIITPGGKPTIFFTMMLLGEPGSEIIYPEPGFPIYESMINYSGAKAVPMFLKEQNDFSFKADEVLKLIKKNTRLIIINNPQNPTGALISKNEIKKLVQGLKKYPDICILSDEIYSRQIYDGKDMPTFLNYPEIYDRLIVLDGWSKSYAMTGWRLGWSVWPDKLIEKVTRLVINSYSCVSAANQIAALAALEGSDEFINNMMNEFSKRRKLIVNGLNNLKGIKCSNPGGTFYDFPNIINTGLNGEQFAEKCLNEAGVAIVPGTSFGKSCVNYVRFIYANSYENIEKSFDKISKII